MDESSPHIVFKTEKSKNPNGTQAFFSKKSQLSLRAGGRRQILFFLGGLAAGRFWGFGDFEQVR